MNLFEATPTPPSRRQLIALVVWVIVFVAGLGALLAAGMPWFVLAGYSGAVVVLLGNTAHNMDQRNGGRGGRQKAPSQSAGGEKNV